MPQYPFTPSQYFDFYWYFAAERQNIFFKRVMEENFPWTDDHILQKYKFTNTYRATDRVSQFLIRDVIYTKKSFTSEDIFLRIILFKIFNKIATWKLLLSEFTILDNNHFNISRFDELLTDTLKKGDKIFSPAYIMPSGCKNPGAARKHTNCLLVLGKMLDENLPEKIQKADSLKQDFELLRNYPMIGNFLAYQFAIDINYSEITNFSENDFVVPGPGAIRGIKKCILNTNGMTYDDIISWIVEHQEEEFTCRNLAFKTLWGRKLHKIDCQNIFCEIDKYLRAHSPALNIKTTRIKQLFRPNKQPIDFFFPPKWHISLKS